MSYVAAHMRKSLENHQLIQLVDLPNFQSFYLKDPSKGRMMSTLISFTPEGIVLQGDLTPSHHGDVSALGYGLNWFAQDLSEYYLCEKFLTQEFVAEYADRGMREEIIRQRREGEITKDRARELWGEVGVSGDFTGPMDAYEFWTEELGYDDGHGCPGYGYAPGKAGWLCAIQQRFSQLYQERKRATEQSA